MKTTALPPWTIEALAALQPGEEMTVVIPVEPAPLADTEGFERQQNPYTGQVFWRALTPGSIEAGIFCPLGAVEERVAVGYCTLPRAAHCFRCLQDNGCLHCEEFASVHISLTAEPEVKRVRDATRDEWPYAVTDEIGSSNPWAWFCRVRRV